MKIYILATLFSVILYKIIYTFSKPRNRNSFINIFIGILPLIIVSAIRYGVGWDYFDIYTKGFYLSASGKVFFSEKFFIYLNRFIYYFTDNVDWLFIICSIIWSVFLAKAIKDQSVNISMTIILVLLTRYYFLSMNIVRQGIAMAIIVYSLKYIKERNFYRYLILILFAVAFHNMSIIFVPIYFIGNIDIFKGRNKLIILYLPIILLVIGKILLKIIENTKYINYFGSQYDVSKVVISEVLIGMIILIIALINNKRRENEYYNIYLNMQLITVIIALCSKYIPLADRLIWFFSIQNIFFIPILIKETKRKEYKVIYMLSIFFVLTLVFYMQTVVGDSYSVLPYRTIFNKF